MKHTYSLLLCVGLVCGCDRLVPSTATAEEPPAVDVSKLVEECRGCHASSGPLDLSKHSRVDLRAKLDEIRAGKKEHPSDMSKLTDAQLDALSAQLAKKE